MPDPDSPTYMPDPDSPTYIPKKDSPINSPNSVPDSKPYDIAITNNTDSKKLSIRKPKRKMVDYSDLDIYPIPEKQESLTHEKSLSDSLNLSEDSYTPWEPTSPLYEPDSPILNMNRLSDDSYTPWEPTSPVYKPNSPITDILKKKILVTIKNEEYSGLKGYIVNDKYIYNPQTGDTLAEVFIESINDSKMINVNDLIFDPRDLSPNKNVDFMPPQQKDIVKPKKKTKPDIINKFIKLGKSTGILNNLIVKVTEIHDDYFYAVPVHPYLKDHVLSFSFSDNFEEVEEPSEDIKYMVQNDIFWLKQDKLNIKLIINNCGTESVNGEYILWFHSNKPIYIDSQGKVVGKIDGPYYKHKLNNIVITRQPTKDSFKTNKMPWYIFNWSTKKKLYVNISNDSKSLIPPLYNWEVQNLDGLEPSPVIVRKNITNKITKPTKPVIEKKHILSDEYLNVLNDYHRNK